MEVVITKYKESAVYNLNQYHRITIGIYENK